MASICEIHAGEPVPAHYPGPTVAYIIEGTFEHVLKVWVICLNSSDYYIGEVHVTDESKPGEITKLVAGDVIHVDHDSRNTFGSPDKAKCKYIKPF
jgi:hypothetical protein